MTDKHRIAIVGHLSGESASRIAQLSAALRDRLEIITGRDAELAVAEDQLRRERVEIKAPEFSALDELRRRALDEPEYPFSSRNERRSMARPKRKMAWRP